MKNKNLEAHFSLIFFGNLNFKTTSILKAGPILEEAAKLGKATWDAYNLGGWLILEALLKNWVAKGVASKIHDFTSQHSMYYVSSVTFVTYFSL